MSTPLPRVARALPVAAAVMLSACAATGRFADASYAGARAASGTVAGAHTVVIAFDDATLLRVDAADPSRVRHRAALDGLLPGERLLCLDFRPGAVPRLYALSSADRLLTVDADSGAVRPVASRVPLSGRRLGCDFTPHGDELRVVSDAGTNLRLDPDTGRVVAVDGMLAGDMPPAVVAVASTHGRASTVPVSLYGIDAGAGALTRQGSPAGERPAVSPSTGRTSTIGALGTGPLQAAAFDIAPADDTALAVLSIKGRSMLYRIDLGSGVASPVAPLPRAVWALAIEP